jgi:glycosyltransferase involved in cell wall biosynthesis
MKNVVFCMPIVNRPYKVAVESLKAAVPVIEAAGWTHSMAQTIDVPYISAARASMLRAALDAKADVIVFLDYDVGYGPHDLLKLIETEGDVCAGTYRAKIDDEQYMGAIEHDPDTFRPYVRASDGAISAKLVPGGFLKITKEAVHDFMTSYPELCYGPLYHASVDLFNHGVHDRVWYGEDYSFSLNWKKRGGRIWTVPDLNIDHHGKDGKVYKGNFHHFLCRQPGGSESDSPTPPGEPLRGLRSASFSERAA